MFHNKFPTFNLIVAMSNMSKYCHKFLVNSRFNLCCPQKKMEAAKNNGVLKHSYRGRSLMIYESFTISARAQR